jgi:hypothetical protein
MVLKIMLADEALKKLKSLGKEGLQIENVVSNSFKKIVLKVIAKASCSCSTSCCLS